MSDRPDNYFTMFTGDYLRDTMQLTTRQHGAYQLLLMHYYGTGKPLPLNDETIRIITRETPEEWAIDRPEVMSFFSKETDGWRQKRADKELVAAAKRYEKAVKAAEAKHGAKRGPKQGSEQLPSMGPSSPQAPTRAGPEQVLGACQPSPSPSVKEVFAFGKKTSLTPTAPAPDGSAASPSAGPGWEAEFPRWASWRVKIGDAEWALWFAKSRPNGSEASLVADSPFTATKIREKYEDALTVHFMEPVTIHEPNGGSRPR